MCTINKVLADRLQYILTKHMTCLEDVEDSREFEANYGRAQSFGASSSVQWVPADKDLSMGLRLSPIIVKRNAKFPVNWNGPGGTVVLIDKPKGL